MIDVALLEGTGTAGTLELRLGFGEQACRLFSSWAPPGEATLPDREPPPTGPLPTCLAAAATESAALNAWIHGLGQTADDPTLRIPMTRGTAAEEWVNALPAAARVFVRRCGEEREFVPYAELRIQAGRLRLVPWGTTPEDARLVLSADEVRLTRVEAATWLEMRQSCGDAHVPLPTVPAPGVSSDLAGDPVSAPDSPTPGQRIQGLRDAIVALVYEETLARPEGARLVRELDRAEQGLSLGLAGKAVANLDEFGSDVDALAEDGEIPADAAGGLREAAASTRDQIDELARGGAPIVPPGCIRDCVYETFHVRAAGGGLLRLVPDGSPERPFETIEDALAEARERGLCGVEVVLHGPFAYREDIGVARNLRIRGVGDAVPTLRGSIVNRDGWKLELERLTLRESPEPGAVVADHPCAETRIVDVGIVDAADYGVWQSGGALNVVDLIVRGTRAGDDLMSDGVGVFLAGGVEADLEDVELIENESGGLTVTGTGTTLAATETLILGNGVNPDFAARRPCRLEAGGLVVSSGGSATIELSTILANEFMGLLANGEGSRIEVRDSFVDETRGVAVEGGCQGLGGFNVYAVNGGAVELSTFQSLRAELAGLSVTAGGTIDAHEGFVELNAIGAHVDSEGFDLRRLQDRVLYRFNDRTLDSSALPVPVPAPPR